MKSIPQNLMVMLLLALAPAVGQSQVPHLITYHGRAQSDGDDINGTARFKFALVSLAEDAAVAALAEASLLNGAIVQVTIADPGSGYLSEPRVSVTDPTGTGAELRAVVDQGVIASIVVVNGGRGYTSPSVVIEAPPPSAGDVTHWSQDGSSLAGAEPGGSVEVAVQDGMFSVVLGEGGMAPLNPQILANSNLRLRVWMGDEETGFEQLTPDQQLTSTPYAMMAGALPPGTVTGNMIEPGSIETIHLSQAAQNAPWNDLDHLDLGDEDTYGSLHIYHNDTGAPALIFDGQTVRITAMGQGNQPKFELQGLDYGHLTLSNWDGDNNQTVVLTSVNEAAANPWEGGGALYLGLPQGGRGSILEARPEGGQLTLMNGNGENRLIAFGEQGELRLMSALGQPAVVASGQSGTLRILQSDGEASVRLYHGAFGGEIAVNGLEGNPSLTLRNGLADIGGEALVNRPNGEVGVYLAGSVPAPPFSSLVDATVEIIGDENGGMISVENGTGQNTVEIRGHQAGSAGAGLLRLRKTSGASAIVLDSEDADGNGRVVSEVVDAEAVFAELVDIPGNGQISVRNNAGQETVEITGQEGAHPGGQILLKRPDGATSMEIDGLKGAAGGSLLRLNKADGTSSIVLDSEDFDGNGRITSEVVDANAVLAEWVDIPGSGQISVRNNAGQETVEITGQEGASPGGQIVLRRPDGSISMEIDGLKGAAGGSLLRLRKSDGSTAITLDSEDNDGNGRVVTEVLEITGGSDFSEQFRIHHDSGEVLPGMVVSIDPRTPGDLVVSKRPYDRKVAGVISGANGVRPGLLMGQTGTIADGEHAVALTGRVYCHADASFGAIEPGDLLTTSETPGHAIKVTDHEQAPGAVIGKAMTPLASGRGLVLVLVNLQ